MARTKKKATRKNPAFKNKMSKLDARRATKPADGGGYHYITPGSQNNHKG